MAAARAISGGAGASSTGAGSSKADAMAAVQRAHKIAQSLDRAYRQKQIDAAGAGAGHFEAEIEINDYPQQARWKVSVLYSFC